jgi:hypothetical protein
MAEQAKISIRPSEFVEGGAVPVDKNLTWKECRFSLFDYTRKSGEVVATTCAARIKYVDDEGTEYVQHYSAADPERFLPSKDQKTLVAQAGAQALAKSSNFHVLMNALVNAGFPEDKLDADISTLDGLVTFNIGVPEPKRSGLKREEPAEGARERVISVPSKIVRLPWEKAPAKGAAGKAPKAAAAEAPADDLSADAVAIVASVIKGDVESATRQRIATEAIRAKKNPVAKYVYTDDFAAALIPAGYVLDGETISKA